MKFTIVYFVRFFYLCSPSAHLTIVLSVVVKDCVYHTAAMCTRPRTGFQPEPESEVSVSIISELETESEHWNFLGRNRKASIAGVGTKTEPELKLDFF